MAMGRSPSSSRPTTWFFAGRSSGSFRSGLPLVQFFSTIGLLLLAFITFWFYRHTRIAKRIQDPARPSETFLRRTVWPGVVATNLSSLFSMLILLFEVGTLLFYFLSPPQAGQQSAGTTSSDDPDWDLPAFDSLKCWIVTY
jgi:hypothetical protein